MHIKNVCRRLIFICLMGLTQNSLAEVQFGLDYGGLLKSNTGTTVSSVDRSVLNGFFSVGLNKLSTFQLHVGYIQIDHIENFSDSTYQSTVSTNPYVGLGYLFKHKNLPVGLTLAVGYSPSSKLTISDSTQSEIWDGSSTIVKTGFTVNVNARLSLATSLMYVLESYNQKVTGSITGKSALEQSYFAPCLGIGLAF